MYFCTDVHDRAIYQRNKWQIMLGKQVDYDMILKKESQKWDVPPYTFNSHLNLIANLYVF